MPELRTGRTQVSETPVYVSQKVYSGVPNMTFSGQSAAAQAMFGIAATLQRAGSQYARVETAEALEQARQTAIETVDQNRTFEPVRKKGAFWREYNRSGLAAYMQELELSARTNIARIAAEHRNDPKAMEESLASFRVGQASDLPVEIRRGYEKDFEVWSRPHINAALGRELELSDRSAKGSLIELQRQRHSDARALGMTIGAADPETEAGMGALTSAAQSLASMYDDTFIHLQRMIDDHHLTIGEAEAAIGTERQQITANLLLGAFETTDDKEAFLLDFANGDLRVPIPQVVTGDDPSKVEDDILAFTTGNPIEVLDAKTFGEVRQHMTTRVAAIQNAREEARKAVTRAAELEAETLLAQFAATRDPALLDDIEQNPKISLSEKASARAMLRDMGTVATDWDAYDRTLRGINIDPAGVTIGSIRSGPFARTEQEALISALVERQKQDHFANAPGYRQAEARIDRVIGQISNDIVTVVGGTTSEATSQRTRAAALLKQDLYDATLDMQRQGFEIGPNPSGKPLEVIGDTTRFDPEVYARERITRLRELSGQAQGPVNELRDRMRQLQIEQTQARQAGDAARANELGDEIIATMDKLRMARKSLDLSELILLELQ